MRLTAQDLLQLGIIDQIIAEPVGGAHRKRDEAIAKVGEVIAKSLNEVVKLDKKTLIAQRHAKYLNMGKKSVS